jgi:hypothetical protein
VLSYSLSRSELYTIIEFPQEDILEDGVVAAEAANHETQAALTSESQTMAVLSRASKALQDCAQAMASAKDMSTYGQWSLLVRGACLHLLT